MTVMTAILIWFGIGLLLAPLNYALSFAYLQRKFESLAAEDVKEDRRTTINMAIVMIPVGLLGPVVMFFLTERAKYGLKWR